MAALVVFGTTAQKRVRRRGDHYNHGWPYDSRSTSPGAPYFLAGELACFQQLYELPLSSGTSPLVMIIGETT